MPTLVAGAPLLNVGVLPSLPAEKVPVGPAGVAEAASLLPLLGLLGVPTGTVTTTGWPRLPPPLLKEPPLPPVPAKHVRPKSQPLHCNMFTWAAAGTQYLHTATCSATPCAVWHP